jgi:hypothetical protein
MGEGGFILVIPDLLFNVVNIHHFLNISLSEVNGDLYYGDYEHGPCRDSPNQLRISFRILTFYAFARDLERPKWYRR